MATATPKGPTTRTSTLRNVGDNQKRWMVFGLALKVLVDQIRSFLAQEIQKEYGNLKTSHKIDTQSTSGRLKNWPTFLKYENINGNDVVPKLRGKHDYSAFDCRVTSHVDFAKLYVDNYMAKFTAFDERCDASAVLNLLGKVPVFSSAVQSAAGSVRQARNAWAHCMFSDWSPVKFHQCFVEMEKLVKELGLASTDESNLLTDLKEWESKGTLLCMNVTMDPDLLKFVQQHVNALNVDVDKLAFEVESDREAVKKALQGIAADLNELEKRVSSVEQENEGLKRSIQSLQDEQSTMEGRLKCLKSDHECLQQRVAQVEEPLNSPISFEIADCEGDISYYAQRYDTGTRQWLLEDVDNWFNDPGVSRAYVLLGDAGVGKSVIAGALAQREKNAGHLGAAYFCLHGNAARNDPRYLLGTIACQLCKCSIQYSNLVGGEGGVRMMLANSNLGVLELFTKLLHEPLGKCTSFEQRKLVIIDALDETKYESRDDFLDLIMHYFPRLPKWLVFFITSRPEDTVQFRLKKYNRCIKICAGNRGEHLSVYRQHEQDIKLFLEKRVNFSPLPYSAEDLAKHCSGLFLYAFCIAEVLNDPVHSGDQLSDLFPGDIDNFFLKNFRRIFDKVGDELSRKLFGCVIAAPSPLPLSFISFILKRENSNLDEQEVIDAVSLFVVVRASDQSFSFLHNLIPSWLTDKNKSSRRLFVDRIEAGKYLRIVVKELLPAAINDGLEKHPSIESDLLEYVLRVGVRVLCGCDETDSLKVVYSCLTTYQFIQKRIQKNRTEIYSIIGDFKLSTRCQALNAVEKEILQEISTVLESNIQVLVECPHLLSFCLRNASKAVQTKVAIPVSDTRMELTSWLPLFGSACKPPRDNSCFALSPDKKLLAEGKGKYISFFDSCSLERLLGPIEVQEVKETISHLAFCPGGNFVFFGRLDKWFSVERGRVEEIPHFSGNDRWCEWGSFTFNQQHIVVKRKRLSPHNWLCLLSYLCWWAKEEITHSQLADPLCRCFPREVTVLKNRYSVSHQEPCISAVKPLLDLLRRMQCDRWWSLLEKVKLKGLFGTFLSKKCHECKSRKYDTLTLTDVRQYIVNHYSEIFDLQVWDLQTGKPALGRAFSSGVQLSPFASLCHLSTAIETCGTLFTDIDKALSFCNIALLNVICHHHLFRLEFNLALTNLSFRTGESHLSPEGTWVSSIKGETVYLFRDVDQKNPIHEIREVEGYSFLNEHFFLYSTVQGTLHSLCLHTGTTTSVSKFLSRYSCDYDYENNLRLETLANSSTILTELHDLPNEGKKLAIFSGSTSFISPGGIWRATRRDWRGKVYLFHTRNQHQQHSENPEHVIKGVAQFAFTKLNGNSFFLYLTFNKELHALSLQTGTILQCVSGLSPNFFVAERQVGYFFYAEDEDATVFLKDLPSGFLSSLFFIPAVEKPMLATFVSADTILVLSLDLELVLWQTTGDETTKAIASKKSFLTTPCGRLERQQVAKGLFSPDGKLVAIHCGTKISLHSTTEPASGKFLCSIFEAAYKYSVVQFTFSADSALLLFSVLRDDDCPYIVTYVSDVRKGVISASFDSQSLLSEDFCCCFSSDNKKIVLCTELYIEIWDHAAHPCRLLTRMVTDVLYNEADKITHCAMSRENNLLACCVVDRIRLYSLNSPVNQPVLELPRAHLGKIQFCQFFGGNRYLISYGVDGAVFIWDLNERKAISYARIAQGRESIDLMTVSPKEDKVVCFTSSGRIYLITLCGLKCEPLSLQFESQRMTREHNVATFQSAACFGVEAGDEDPVEISKFVEEMNFALPSDDDSDSNNDDDGESD